MLNEEQIKRIDEEIDRLGKGKYMKMGMLEQIKKDFKVQCKECDFCIFIGRWKERRDWGIFEYDHYRCNSFKCSLSQAQVVAWRHCLLYLDSRKGI